MFSNFLKKQLIDSHNGPEPEQYDRVKIMCDSEVRHNEVIWNVFSDIPIVELPFIAEYWQRLSKKRRKILGQLN